MCLILEVSTGRFEAALSDRLGRSEAGLPEDSGMTPSPEIEWSYDLKKVVGVGDVNCKKSLGVADCSLGTGELNS